VSIIDNYIKKTVAMRHVSVAEFAESSDYCGKPLYPLQRVLLKTMFLEELSGKEEDQLTWLMRGGRSGEVFMSPDVRRRRDIMRERGAAHFGEINLVGGRRSSKGHITGLAGAYKLWLVQQLDDPGEYFNLDPDKVLDFVCVAASFDQAKTLQFADLRASISACKPLQPYLSKDLEEILTIKTDADIEQVRERGSSGRDFARLRVRPMAANSDTIRGTASLLLVFDEFAFFLPGESRQSAQQVYGAAEPSLAQFGHHALVFANSSPWTRVGQFFEQYSLSMRPEDHPEGWYPQNLAVQFPSWALFDKWWEDENGRWKNAIMVSPDWPDLLEPEEPRSALDPMSQGKRENEKLKEKANKETYKVERRAQWAEVLDAYFDPDVVDRVFSGWLPDGRQCGANYSGTYRFAFVGHCDPSSTTAGFGFAMGHVEEFPCVDPAMAEIWPGGMERHVVFDFVKRWNPDDFAGHTINYIEVRKELAHWVSIFRPVSLTFDQYNSVGLIQELREDARKMGVFNTQIGEVTATAAINWNRWEATKTAFNLGLVHIPPDCLDPRTGFDHSGYASLELKFLQEIQTGQTKRVDKQSMGPVQTKDVADCIAEVTVKFLGSYLGDITGKAFTEAQLATGAEGGYQIGGRNPNAPRGGERFEEFMKGRGQAGAQAARGFDMTGRHPRRRGR